MDPPAPAHDWVFGYGSLVSETHPVRMESSIVSPRWASLLGHRRRWNVAMENRAAVSDPKHYLDPETGERPDLYVAYLNVVADEHSQLNGLLIPVDDVGLAAFDRREVNYRRVDVSHSISPAPPGRTWCYLGLQAGVERYAAGAEEARVFIADEYHLTVRAAFAHAGPEQVEAYEDSTDAPRCPEMRLRLHRA